MCVAAIEFAGLGSTRFLANDPSDDEVVAHGPETDVSESLWAVVANVMFLHNVAWVGGRDNPIVTRNARLEPETTSLALRILDDETFIKTSANGGDVLEALATTWEGVVEANGSRVARGRGR